MNIRLIRNVMSPLAMIAFVLVASPMLYAQATDKLSVPVFDPRPVVWVDDWKPSEVQPSPIREAARLQMQVADQLKSQKEYDKAEKTYLRAMRTDPLWAYPPYQLACNYELSGQHEKAVPVFEKAIKLGFADFPTALADDELGELRNAEDFSETLAAIRERYVQKSMERIGTPVAVKPEGDQPADGWPLMLLLHGYGDSNENYVVLAREWAKLGFVAVAVPGSIPSREAGFTWAMESEEPTLRDLRAIVASEQISKVINKEKVFMLGFSQGALHAMLLAAKHRDEFAGVVALSPGGSLAQQLLTPSISKGRAGRLVFIHGKKEPHAVLATRWRKACGEAGWEFGSGTHDGGHHFPDDWDQQRPTIAEFLLK